MCPAWAPHTAFISSARLSRRSDVAFVSDVFRNACDLQAVLEAEGRDERRHAPRILLKCMIMLLEHYFFTIELLFATACRGFMTSNQASVSLGPKWHAPWRCGSVLVLRACYFRNWLNCDNF